jgi:hypothetical protein
MRSSLFASVAAMEFQTTEVYSTLDLTNAKYDMSMRNKYNNNNNCNNKIYCFEIYLHAGLNIQGPITESA